MERVLYPEQSLPLQVAFVISFLACRVVVGPFLAYKVFVCPTSSLIVKVSEVLQLVYNCKQLQFC